MVFPHSHLPPATAYPCQSHGKRCQRGLFPGLQDLPGRKFQGFFSLLIHDGRTARGKEAQRSEVTHARISHPQECRKESEHGIQGIWLMACPQVSLGQYSGPNHPSK